MNISRRDMLKLGAGAAAFCSVGMPAAGLLAAQTAKKIPIGIQLFSVRDVAPKDPVGTIEALAKMGYQGVEFAGYYKMKAEDLRKVLDDNGLQCCGSHLATKDLAGDALKKTVEFNKILGNKYLIVASLPGSKMASVAGLMDTVKFFNDVAERVKEDGMRVGYHSHYKDFIPVANQAPWDVIFGNANPDVLMQLDVGHCVRAGADPVAVLKKYPHRSATIHIREHGPDGTVVGEGEAPWQEVFEVCETIGDTEWYIVEQEKYKDSPLESVKLCLDNLRKMGK